MAKKYNGMGKKKYNGMKKMSKGMERYREMQSDNIFYEDYREPSNLPQEKYIKMASPLDYVNNDAYPDSPREQVDQMNELVRGMKNNKAKVHYY